jgi:hypothetical protein
VSLLFAVSDLQNELNAFSELASELLFPGAQAVLSATAGQLTGIARSGSDSQPIRWCINKDNPLLTMPSQGAYMPDDQGGLTVHGEITFVWELQPVRPLGDTRPARHVRLNGLASTAIRLLSGEPWAGNEAKELAAWRMEVADLSAPGAFFHVQVLGREKDESFPKALDIPRLPGVLNSPFACMEFVLGELFQKRWERIAQKDSAPCRQWRSIQAHRHHRHLRWAAEQVSTTSGSPWVAWKVAKPHEELFLPD